MTLGRPCTGVILAGGNASRFEGREKGLVTVGGVRIIDRVARALEPATDGLLVSANHDAASRWLPGVPVIADRLPGNGSLGGLHAALVAAGTAVLLVAWDMPFVAPDLLRALRDASDDADVVVPESDSPRGFEPLCAWYGSACLPAVEERLAAGDRRMIGFHDKVRVARLERRHVAAFGDPARLFLNVNTSDDLILAESLASTAAAGDRRP